MNDERWTVERGGRKTRLKTQIVNHDATQGSGAVMGQLITNDDENNKRYRMLRLRRERELNYKRSKDATTRGQLDRALRSQRTHPLSTLRRGTSWIALRASEPTLFWCWLHRSTWKYRLDFFACICSSCRHVMLSPCSHFCREFRHFRYIRSFSLHRCLSRYVLFCILIHFYLNVICRDDNLQRW